MAVCSSTTRLIFRKLHDDATGRFREWVNEARNRSGIYVIRGRNSRGAWRVLYVGMSKTGTLDQTFKRHFYPWGDVPALDGTSARFECANRDHGPGVRYDRRKVEGAIVFMPPAAAPACEKRLIAQLRPRDNCDSNAAPF